jgi:hypothetical protein
LRYTAALASDLLQGRLPVGAASVAAPFPPQYGPDERLWASGPFQLYELRAPGDGSYVEDGSLFFATGGLGLALTAAFYGVRKAGNNRRRREAEEALVPRWMEVAAGTLYLGTHGLYMHSPHGLWPWSWADIEATDMIGPAWMRFTGQGQNGQVTRSIVSEWAELLFVSWVMARRVRHPQLLDGSWWPGGWRGGPASGPAPGALPGSGMGSGTTEMGSAH